MIKRLNTTRLFGAIVLCFILFSAFNLEPLRLPAPIDRPEETKEVIATLEMTENPYLQALKNPSRLEPLPPELIDSETLWLARAIFSETKRPEEQVLVAWVIRNRVETGYRGKKTYRDVVLDPYQFSAFSTGSAKRPYYASLDASSGVSGWQRTLSIAYGVRHVNPARRPFSETTRHFFSERSMANRVHPEWVDGHAPVEPDSEVQIDRRRFRFYDGIS